MKPATAPKDYNSVIETCLVSMCCFHKCTKYFIKEVLCLFLSISKVNFTQLSRYSARSEQSFRINFSKSFDWFDFNLAMIKQHCRTELTIVIDPSFVSKSGEKTTGVGCFWSGCAGACQARSGVLRTRSITDRAEKLLDISQVVVADAYFSKKNLVNPLTQAAFTIVQDGVSTCVVEAVALECNVRYRDGKQHTALVNCQARNKEKLHFHFNATLSAINIAKVVHWYSIQNKKKELFLWRQLK